jgi:hypothetical protein
MAQEGWCCVKKDLGIDPVLHARQKKLAEHEKTLGAMTRWPANG